MSGLPYIRYTSAKILIKRRWQIKMFVTATGTPLKLKKDAAAADECK